VKARLSKDGWWVVCGDVSCGVRFGERRSVPEDIRDKLAGWTHLLAIRSEFVYGDDHRWRMPRRVWLRISKGQSPAVRRAPQSLKRKSVRVFADTRDYEYELPAVTVCPACDREQALEMAELELGDPSCASILAPAPLTSPVSPNVTAVLRSLQPDQSDRADRNT
jgi:hypothetical protein